MFFHFKVSCACADEQSAWAPSLSVCHDGRVDTLISPRTPLAIIMSCIVIFKLLSNGHGKDHIGIFFPEGFPLVNDGFSSRTETCFYISAAVKRQEKEYVTFPVVYLMYIYKDRVAIAVQFVHALSGTGHRRSVPGGSSLM